MEKTPPKDLKKKKKDKKFNHTNRLKGFLPTMAGIETAESTLISPMDLMDSCFSSTLCDELLLLLLLSLLDPLFHLKEEIFGVRGNENLLFESPPDGGVPGTILSLGLLLALTLAFAETVGAM